MERQGPASHTWFNLLRTGSANCQQLQSLYVDLKWNAHINWEACPFSQMGLLSLWTTNRQVFQEFVRWFMVYERFSLKCHFIYKNRKDIVADLLKTLYPYGLTDDGVWEQQLDVIDFFLSLGYPFPSFFYQGEWHHDRLCACLCAGAHARLLDLGLPVSELWGHRTAPGDAQFIRFLWESRQKALSRCIALIGVVHKRRRDLGACVNRDVLRIMVRMIWRQRWDEVGLPDSFFKKQ